MAAPLAKRFVVFNSDEGMVAVNPEHVCLVEPHNLGATIHFAASGPGSGGAGHYTRRVKESFDEVMRSLRGEERPRLPR